MGREELIYCTYNVNGMNDVIKRRKIFSVLKHQQINISLLQETHAVDDILRIWQSEWGGKIYASNAHNSTKGVMVLFDRGFQGEIQEVRTDNEGRAIYIELLLNHI